MFLFKFCQFYFVVIQKRSQKRKCDFATLVLKLHILFSWKILYLLSETEAHSEDLKSEMVI